MLLNSLETLRQHLKVLAQGAQPRTDLRAWVKTLAPQLRELGPEGEAVLAVVRRAVKAPRDRRLVGKALWAVGCLIDWLKQHGGSGASGQKSR